MIRKANLSDLSRIAEILVFNKRINYRPIFHNDDFSFNELQVINVAKEYSRLSILNNIYVYDDGIVKGMIHIDDKEIKELYVEHFFQNQGIGSKLIEYAIVVFECNYLWALEKNRKAIEFYNRHGFVFEGEKKFEEGTNEFLIKLKR